MALEVTIEDYVAPEKAPSRLAPLIQSLIEAGPDKVATVTAETEEEGNVFVREFQAAARDAGKSGVKRGFTAVMDGKKVTGYKVSMAVRDKITRPRGGKTEVTTADSE